MASFRSWVAAMRPRTLFLAVGTAVCGSGLAFSKGCFSIIVCILTLLTASLLQILSNMANDLGDYQQGTDITGKRVGPQRAIQSGKITPQQMKKAIAVFVALSVLVGAALVYIALQFMPIAYILIFLLLGAAAILAAIKYTAGKNPYGYKGLGDLFSFIFFGPVPVVGTYFLHTHSFDFVPWLPALGLGFLSAAVLNLNNMRDIENDKESSKRTIPVLIGVKNAKFYHACLIISATLCFLVYGIIYLHVWYQYLYMLVFLCFLKILSDIYRIHDNRLLDPYLKYTSMFTFFLSVVFIICINS